MNKFKNEMISFGNENISSTVDVKVLRDTEQSILNYMLISPKNFKHVKDALVWEDFTFLTHQEIYNCIIKNEELLCNISNDKLFSLKEIEQIIRDVVYLLRTKVKKESILQILTNTPSMSIDRDLNIIQFYSSEKIYAFDTQKAEDALVEFQFKDSHSETIARFVQNRLVAVLTTNIEHIPDELYDTALDTIKCMQSFDFNDPDMEISFSPREEEPVGCLNFSIQKNIGLIEKQEEKKDKMSQALFKWADEYKLDQDTFPRDKYSLLNITELSLSNKGIKELPEELVLLENLLFLDLSFNQIKTLPKNFGQLKSLSCLTLESNKLEVFPEEVLSIKDLILLSLKANKLKSIPKEIGNLELLTNLCLCCNDIEYIPDEISKVKKLDGLCIHRNKLKSIPDNISKLVNLKRLAVSNNDLKQLPHNISDLPILEHLEFENNSIEDIDINFLKLSKLKNITFDDALLDDVLENVHLLSNIDAINLNASSIASNDADFIKKYSFSVDSTSWIEEEDKRENGCIKLYSSMEKEIN